MIRFEPPVEPPQFERQVRAPGTRWLTSNPNATARPPDHWNRCKSELAYGFKNDERVIRQRREWYRMYQDGELTLEGLRAKAPLIAAAIDKTDR